MRIVAWYLSSTSFFHSLLPAPFLWKLWMVHVVWHVSLSCICILYGDVYSTSPVSTSPRLASGDDTFAGTHIGSL